MVVSMRSRKTRLDCTWALHCWASAGVEKGSADNFGTVFKRPFLRWVDENALDQNNPVEQRVRLFNWLDVPAFAVGALEEGIGPRVSGESHRGCVPVQFHTGVACGDIAELNRFRERTGVCEIVRRFPARENGVDPRVVMVRCGFLGNRHVREFFPRKELGHSHVWKHEGSPFSDEQGTSCGKCLGVGQIVA